MKHLKRLTIGLAALALLVTGGLRGPADAAQKDAQADLIGKAAPDLQGDFALNGKKTKLSDLKGKVVLVDFWAVWCGPCIATFPHLRDWQKEYGTKGLQILGVTTYYQTIGFDANTKRVKRVEKMSATDEQSMLKQFAAHHKLTHRLMTLTQDDWKQAAKDYKVRGIPTMVLIDRKGIVRLVKVGSGDDNARAIEAEIKKLLAEK